MEGADEQLAGKRGHNGRKNGRHQQTGNPGIKEERGENNEDAFVIFLDEARYIRVEREVRSTEEAHAHSACQAKEHPQRGDAAGIRNHLDGFGGHEAHENMRLPEVTESPCQKTDDADNRLTFHHVEHARVDFCQTCCRRRKAARVVHDGNGVTTSATHMMAA